MKIENIKTLGQLKASGYKSTSIKDELRNNLREKIKTGQAVFEGVHGFENTVIPELERAILSRHNINLLGLRGQAKTRLARKMVELLDEYIPFVAGSEINDDPLNPISRFAKDLIAEKGEETPISWLHRSERFFEKLATPDVTVADLIGDVDPIKAANLRLSYADDRVIHFGMIPRANRCIFVINELPDLQARIQVALFNILQEGDIQIRGFKLRMPLVTPLKDRIGSQILTHYPETVKIARTITEQEAKLDQNQNDVVYIPGLARDILEQISFEARESEYIDNKSGVSARMSITAFENLISTAERRALLSGADKTTLRLSDFIGIIPAITGKVELVYEGEQEGAAFVAQSLIGSSIRTLFPEYFPKIEKLEKSGEKTPYTDLIEWFFAESGFELLDDCSDAEYQTILDEVTPLDDLIKKYQPQLDKKDQYFMKEFLLWGLVEYRKLSKDRFAKGHQFKDTYGSYISKL
jgi:magnesium chelatase subunit I